MGFSDLYLKSDLESYGLSETFLWLPNGMDKKAEEEKVSHSPL